MCLTRPHSYRSEQAVVIVGQQRHGLHHRVACAQLRLLPRKRSLQPAHRPAVDLRLHLLGLMADDHHRLPDR